MRLPSNMQHVVSALSDHNIDRQAKVSTDYDYMYI